MEGKENRGKTKQNQESETWLTENTLHVKLWLRSQNAAIKLVNLTFALQVLYHILELISGKHMFIIMI